MIKQEALIHVDDYVYLDMYPHSENPVSDDTFEELDGLIDSINNGLGIIDSRYYGVSLGLDNEPTVSVNRVNYPNVLRSLSIFLESNDGSVSSISVRNDAGTHSDRFQIAGNKTIYNKLDVIAGREVSIISDQELASVSNLVLERSQKGSFVKERQIFNI